jgi:Fe2+ transport system protein FeoA
MPLTQLQDDQTATVREVIGGRRVTQRLAAVGILPGATISVQRNHGTVVLRIRADRLILGRNVAAKVMVERAGLAPLGAS